MAWDPMLARSALLTAAVMLPQPAVHRVAPNRCRMNVHSDSRPTEEYMDFLLGRNQQEDTVDMPSIIVGDGRIGGMLAELGERKGHENLVIRRGDPIPDLQAGGQLVRKPIYVCTSAADLESVIAATPEARREDLVFLQDGQLEPLRQKYGLYDTTQARAALTPADATSRPPTSQLARARRRRPYGSRARARAGNR